MAKLKYLSENQRIATADHNGIAVIPTEDMENERIVIIYTDDSTPTIIDLGDGYYSIEGQEITEDYVDPTSLNLTVDQDGYSPIPE